MASPQSQPNIADIQRNRALLDAKYASVRFTATHKVLIGLYLLVYGYLIVQSLGLNWLEEQQNATGFDETSLFPIIKLLSPLLMAALTCVTLYAIPWMTRPFAKLVIVRFRIAQTAFLMGYAVFGLTLMATFFTLGLSCGWIFRLVLFLLALFYTTIIAAINRFIRDAKEIAKQTES